MMRQYDRAYENGITFERDEIIEALTIYAKLKGVTLANLDGEALVMFDEEFQELTFGVWRERKQGTS